MLNQKDNAVSVMQEFFPNGGRDFDDVCALFDAIAAGKVPGVFVHDTENTVGSDEASMANRKINPTDEEILAAMTKWGHSNSMTYIIANILRSDGFRELKTSFVLRRLKKLEAQGQVKRVKSVYATQLCWTKAAESQEKAL